MLPGTAHERQVPLQSVPQQIPWAQKPELHSAALPQVAPTGFLPQLPLRQLLGGRQSLSLAQICRHLPSVPHMNGAHDCPGVVTQVPVPSQRNAVVSVEPSQPACLHIVPVEYFWQAPAPSQTPLVPQLAAPWSEQSLRGLVPTSAGRQFPTAPGAAQLKQVSVQARLQQTPSAQNPLAQSAGIAQAWPSGSPGAPPVSPRSTPASPAAPPAPSYGASTAASRPPAEPPLALPPAPAAPVLRCSAPPLHAAMRNATPRASSAFLAGNRRPCPSRLSWGVDILNRPECRPHGKTPSTEFARN
jgi:hypothetical protein